MSKKQAIKSLSFLWIGSLLGSGSTFLIYMILARELGAEKFGLFSSAFSIATVLSIIAGFGVAQSWLKHFGKEGWEAIRWIPSSFKLVFYSIIFVLFILFTWAYFGPHDEITRKLLYIFSIFIIGQMIIELVSVKLQLEERYPTLALWQLLPNLIRLILVAGLVYFISESINILEIAYIYIIVAIFFIFLGIYQLYLMKIDKFELQGHGEKKIIKNSNPTVKEAFSHSWAFGLGSMFAFIYVQSDIIMVKYIAGDEQAGLYNVGFIILTALYMFPSALYQKYLLPKFHRWANHDRENFFNVYKKGNFIMLILGIIIAILIWAFSWYFVPLIFGKEYEKSVVLVNILACTLPFYLIAFSVASTLVTQEHMKKKVIYMGIVAIVNIILNAILIPFYQALGAAVATVLSNALLLGIYVYANKKYVFNNLKENND